MSTRSRTLLTLLALGLLYAAGAWVRIEGTLGDPGLDTRDATGMMRSDPGLLYYFTQRIVEAGGLPPEDFRQDLHVEWPQGSDVPAMFAVGQEFLVAWAWLAFGGQGSLHAFAGVVMSLIAALAVLGAFGMAWEGTRSRVWALLAAGLFTVLPFNYRTVGMILQREDLSLPLFSLAAWAIARGAARTSRPAWILGGLLSALSLATWHAMGFFASLVVASLWVEFLLRGSSPLRRRHAYWVPLIVVLACGVIPVLRSKAFLLSPAMCATLALLVTAWIEGRSGSERTASPNRVRTLGLGALLACFGLSALLRAAGWAGQEDMSHVLALFGAKIANLGVLPRDPGALTFDARLLWQGPFVTASGLDFALGLGAAIPLAAATLLVGARQVERAEGARGPLVPIALLAVSLLAAWLVWRTMILPALLIGPCAAMVFARTRLERAARIATTVLLLAQATFFVQALGKVHQDWYANGSYLADLRHMARWFEQNVPAEEAVLGDFVASTVVLSSSRHPIVLQPKYETRRSRERIERFYRVYAHGSLAELATLMREWRCRYLLVDRTILWGLRYVLGVPESQVQPAPGTPAFYSASSPPLPLPPDSPLRLVYRTPQMSTTDSMRVYRLEH